jgi:hypothetical protein
MDVPLLELGAQSDQGHRRARMLSRWGCVAAICFGLVSHAEAAERSGLVRRASCAVVRFYVAKYSATAAEMWARSHGATDADIEVARNCLNRASAQAAQATRWKAME